MKKLMILSAALMVISAVNAQTAVALKSEMATVKTQKKDLRYEKKEERKELRKLAENEAGYQAEQAFLKDFNDAPIIRSERSRSYDEFVFNQDGAMTTAYYDEEAMLVGTSQIKTFTDIPAKAQQSIGKMYKGYSPIKVFFFNDNEANETDMAFYNTCFDDVDSYFVELVNNDKKIVVQVSMDGEVTYFAELK